MPQDFSKLITLLEATKLMPGTPHRNSLVRWATVGARGIKLKTAKFAGKRMTRADWCRDFCNKVVAADPGGTHFDSAPEKRKSVEHGMHHETRAKLKRLGKAKAAKS